MNRDASFMRPIFTAHVRLLREYASSIRSLGYVGSVEQLESVQRRWTGEIRRLGDCEYSHRLKILNLHSVWGDYLDMTLSQTNLA